MLITNFIVLSNTVICFDPPPLPPGIFDIEVLNALTQVVARLKYGLEVATNVSLPPLPLPPLLPPGAPLAPRGPAGPGAPPQLDSFFDVFHQVSLDGISSGLHGARRIHPPTPIHPPEPIAPGGGGTGPKLDSFFDIFYEISLGEVHHTQTDLRTPGRGLDFTWQRHYRSRLGPDSPQGNGWDHSYNIFVQQDGTNIIVADGNTRRDVFRQFTNGVWSADGFFCEGRIDTNGFFILTWADTGRWEFNPFIGPAPGKINRIVDRNSNAMTFAYDGFDRLIRVVDTLDRTNHIAYDANGFIASVTDHTGRQCRYLYHDGSTTNGSLGDLMAAITPGISNTVTGNDFPGGLTNRYTYSTGFADDQRNHNLLTVTDPAGFTWLQCGYATNTNPNDVEFDRVTSLQRAGHPATRLHYLALAASPSNRFATTRAILNDSLGRVREHFYDCRNRLVARREFTGFATPGVVTTDVANRPTGKLRPADPDFFETTMEWNADHLLTRLVYPGGNSVERVHELEFDLFAPRLMRGNLRVQRVHAGPLGGGPATRLSYLEHDPRFGEIPIEIVGLSLVSVAPITVRSEPLSPWSCPVEIVDPRGNVTRHRYDTRGNRTNTVHRDTRAVEDWQFNSFGQVTQHVWPDNGSGHRRRDGFTYYGSGPSLGYVSNVVLDLDTNLSTTTYEYDLAGNVTRMVDPRGYDWLYDYNQLNRLVRHRTPELLPGIRQTNYFIFDSLARLEAGHVTVLDSAGVPVPGSPLTTGYLYDPLGRLLSVTQEVSSVSNAITRYEWDFEDQLTNALSPRSFGTSGAKIQIPRDERGYPRARITDPGGPSQSTSQFDYDPNGNVTNLITGIESGPRTNSSIYGGFFQPLRVTDPMGNTISNSYDPNGNLTNVIFFGQTNDLPGDTGNLRLAEVRWRFDEMDRPTGVIQPWFDPPPQVPIGDGSRSAYFERAPSGLLMVAVDDLGVVTRYEYDSMNRPIRVTDGRSNVTERLFDPGGLPIRIRVTDVSDLGAPDRVVTTTNLFDPLRRLTNTVTYGPGIEITNRFSYDSLGRRELHFDPNGVGTRYEYDGLGRLVRTTLDMNGNGANPAEPADIVSIRGYDANGNLTSVTDDRGFTTAYQYDALDRLVQRTLPDTTVRLYSYDAHGNLVRDQHPTGTVVSNRYDGLSRLTNRVITLGPGIVSTTNETYAYDGLGRLVRAQDEDSLVTFTYDSHGNLVRESLQLFANPPGVTLSQYNGRGDRTNVVYPGGRIVELTPDALGRAATTIVRDVPLGPVTAGLIRSFHGPVVERENYFNNTRLDRTYDGVRRAQTMNLQALAPPALLDFRQFAWDFAGNRVFAQEPAAQHFYNYDAANRLVFSTNTMGPFSLYQLDAVGNRLNVGGTVDPGPYLLNPTLPNPGDAQVNQYTQVPYEGVQRLYDANGNLTQFANNQRQWLYDYRGQTCNHNDLAAPINNAAYRYDALGRRVQRNVNGVITRYYYDGPNVIEEQNSLNATVATYAYCDMTTDGGGWTAFHQQRGGNNYYLHPDDLGSVVKVTDGLGQPAEQYLYGDYGQTFVFDPFGAPLPTTAIGNVINFRGMRLDPESGHFAVQPILPGATWFGFGGLVNPFSPPPLDPPPLWAPLVFPPFSPTFDPRTGESVSRGPDMDDAIPAGFFGPGSEPFQGLPVIGGKSGSEDTVISRTEMGLFGLINIPRIGQEVVVDFGIYSGGGGKVNVQDIACILPPLPLPPQAPIVFINPPLMPGDPFAPPVFGFPLAPPLIPLDPLLLLPPLPLFPPFGGNLQLPLPPDPHLSGLNLQMQALVLPPPPPQGAAFPKGPGLPSPR